MLKHLFFLLSFFAGAACAADQTIVISIPDQQVVIHVPDQSLQVAIPDQTIVVHFPPVQVTVPVPDQTVTVHIPDQTVTVHVPDGATVTPPPQTGDPNPPATADCVLDGIAPLPGLFDSKKLANGYSVSNNDFGATGQLLRVKSAGCWGFTANLTTERGGNASYPSATRGWVQNGAGVSLAVKVSDLTSANMHWAFVSPSVQTTGAPLRWQALADIYFHAKPNPAGGADFPPTVDLMVNQAIFDQASGNGAHPSFYGFTAAKNHPFRVTFGGIAYLGYIDSPDEVSFHSAGGHNIHLLQLPEPTSAPWHWGGFDARTDVGAMVQKFSHANPTDDAGAPIMNSAGQIVTDALISPAWFLSAVNAGVETDVIQSYTNTAFCVQLPGEVPCP